MKRVLKSLIVPMIISLFTLTCASTKTNLTWVWKDETYDEGFLDDIMVIGVSDNFERRKIFEDILVKELKDR